MNLGEELREYYYLIGAPSADFGGPNDYIDYLKNFIKVPVFQVANQSLRSRRSAIGGPKW